MIHAGRAWLCLLALHGQRAADREPVPGRSEHSTAQQLSAACGAEEGLLRPTRVLGRFGLAGRGEEALCRTFWPPRNGQYFNASRAETDAALTPATPAGN